jgi:hypothetical protein
MANVDSAAAAPTTLRPGPTMLVIGLALVVIGAVLAFGLWDLTTKMHRASAEFAAWGRRLETSRWPNPAKLVGWSFLVVGVLLLGEDLIVGIIRLGQGA